MKGKNEVITEFNELVNMTAKELGEWLKTDDSQNAGWPKDDETGESVGHEGGRKIVEILESNPDKDAEKYTDDDVEHMRNVISYCKRHLAQEEKANDEKSIEEVKKSKSYASLKNWGHDCIKARETNGAATKENGHEDSEEQKIGEKRKAPDDQVGENKKRETQNGESATNGKVEHHEEAESTNGKARNGHGQEDHTDEDASTDKAKGPEKGDTVSWNWGKGQPEGKVVDVKPEKTTIETKNGNEVTRKGNQDDPAVVIDTEKSEVIKLSHELTETA